MSTVVPFSRDALRPGVTPLRASPAPRRQGLPAGWPLTALLLLYPVWWALGMATLIVFVLMVPMVAHLVRRPVRVPPGFGLWLLFLVWALASAAMIAYDPPGVLDEPAAGRLISVAYTFMSYLAATVILLFAGNLTEQELPRFRLVRYLGVFFCTVVAGGLLGVLAPRFEFTSLVELLLPAELAQNGFVRQLVHPVSAQLMDILGFPSPRPAAPFPFTNMWGNCLALTLGWFVIGWLVKGDRNRRLFGGLVLAAAAVPVIYSLNRGMWLSFGVAILFILLRLAARGRMGAVGALIAVVLVVAAALVASPLATMVQERLDNPHSNGARVFTTERTLDVLESSPVLGFGSVRDAEGSGASIAAGPSAECPRCGSPPLGANGQLWAALISHGVVGALLFVGFLVRSLWAYRRDHSPIGDAGLLAVVLTLFFMFVYNAVLMPLILTFVSIALLWRNQQATSSKGDAAAGGRAAAAPYRPR